MRKLLLLCLFLTMLPCSVYATPICGPITRAFTGIYSWQIGDYSSGKVFVNGKADFVLNDFYSSGSLCVGVLGSTSDGGMSFDDSYYDPGEVTCIYESYSTGQVLWRLWVRGHLEGGGCVGDSLIPDIFYNNNPFVVDMMYIDDPFNSNNFSASLLLVFAPAPVPEPSTIILLGCGLLLGLFISRRTAREVAPFV